MDKGSDQSKSQIMPLSGGSTTQLTRSPRFIDLSMGDIPPWTQKKSLLTTAANGKWLNKSIIHW